MENVNPAKNLQTAALAIRPTQLCVSLVSPTHSSLLEFAPVAFPLAFHAWKLTRLHVCPAPRDSSSTITLASKINVLCTVRFALAMSPALNVRKDLCLLMVSARPVWLDVLSAPLNLLDFACSVLLEPILILIQANVLDALPIVSLVFLMDA